jgi:hypothetical protein
MLVGEVPFRGETPVRTLAMQLMDPVIPPRQAAPDLAIDDALEAVVLHALAKDRDARPRAMTELLEEIARATPHVPLDPSVAAGFDALAFPPDGDGPLLATHPMGVARSRASSAPPLRARSASAPPPAAPASPAPPSLARTRAASNVPPTVEVTAPPRAAIPADIAEVLPPSPDRPPRPRHRARLSFAAVVALAALAIAGGVLVTTRTRRFALTAAPPSDAGTIARDPVAPKIDAAPAVGAALPEPPPAPPPPAPRRPVARADVEITVRTDPPGADLVIDGAIAGPDGLHLRRAHGTRLTVSCRMAGRRDGRVVVAFEGAGEVRCAVGSARRCVAGLKNPFDDCPPE